MCQGENTYTKRLVICDLDTAYGVIVHKLGCAHSAASWWWCDDGYLFLLPSSNQASSLYAVGRAHGHSARMEVMNERKTVHTRSYYTHIHTHTFKHNKLKHARADVDRHSKRDRDDTHRSNPRARCRFVLFSRIRPKTKTIAASNPAKYNGGTLRLHVRIWESHVFVTRIVYLTLWYWNTVHSSACKQFMQFNVRLISKEYAEHLYKIKQGFH